VSFMFFDAELDGPSTLPDVHLATFTGGLIYMPGVLNPVASLVRDI